MAWLTTDGVACELGNDRISVRIEKDGKATSVVVDGRELLVNLSGAAGDPDRDHSFYCDYHVNQKTRNLVPTRLEVVEEGPDVVHVAYIDDENDRAAYRSSVTGGAPQKLEVVVPAEALEDSNDLVFTTDGYVMYDMIKFEALA